MNRGYLGDIVSDYAEAEENWKQAGESYRQAGETYRQIGETYKKTGETWDEVAKTERTTQRIWIGLAIVSLIWVVARG